MHNNWRQKMLTKVKIKISHVAYLIGILIVILGLIILFTCAMKKTKLKTIDKDRAYISMQNELELERLEKIQTAFGDSLFSLIIQNGGLE